MNRIYQGRVTSVEIVKAKNAQPQPLDGWSEKLWRHHELFQDGVNYYTLALAALAGGAKDEQFQRDWIATAARRAETGTKPANRDKAVPEAESLACSQLQALTAWRAQVCDNWLDGRRKALRYSGPHCRLAPLLGVDADLTDERAAFEACAQAVLLPNGATPAQRAETLLQLLEEADKTDLNQMARDRIVPLCSPVGKCDATPKDLVAHQVRRMLAAVQQLHGYCGSEWGSIAAGLEPGWFITRMPEKLLQGHDALKEGLKRFEMAAKDDLALKEHAKPFEEHLRKQGDALSTHTPGRKVKGPYSLAVVFKLWPCASTAQALKRATQYLIKQPPPEIVPDPIFAARSNDSPLFEYFTNRAFERDPGHENQAAWKEFDIAAFLEAIKAPHRYFQDTQKRESAANQLRARLAAIEAQGASASNDETEHDANFGFADDTRIALLRALVTDPVSGLAYLAETEEAGRRAEYTIQERTLRGWNAIRDKWRALAEKAEATPEKLWCEVVCEQAAHRDDFGSAMLYKKLAEPLYHPIWRDKGTRDWHAEEPLQAWLQYTELRFELADKTRPIRFTPAHAVNSPRFFIFPKKSAAGGRWGSEHEPGLLAFTAGIAVRDGQKWRPQMLRVHYAAPRLRRDELRQPGEETLESVSWCR